MVNTNGRDGLAAVEMEQLARTQARHDLEQTHDPDSIVVWELWAEGLPTVDVLALHTPGLGQHDREFFFAGSRELEAYKDELAAIVARADLAAAALL